MRPRAVVFDGDDNAYQDWLANHPEGFVLTMLRSRPPDKMYLHNSTCYKISSYNRMARPGGFSERAYIKVCARAVGILRDWVRENGRRGTFSGECSACRPT